MIGEESGKEPQQFQNWSNVRGYMWLCVGLIVGLYMIAVKCGLENSYTGSTVVRQIWP